MTDDRRFSSGAASSNLLIVGCAATGGAIAFLLGSFGPMVFSQSNLGPLFGLLVGAPVGLAVGALVGTFLAARRPPREGAGVIAVWLICIWMASLAYSLGAFRFAARAATPGLFLQILVIVCASGTVGREGNRPGLPDWLQRVRHIVIALMIVVFVLTAFPPVRPSRHVAAPSGDALRGPSGPRAVFVWDPRLDASARVPELSVDAPALFLRWCASAALAALSIGTILWQSGRRGSTAPA